MTRSHANYVVIEDDFLQTEPLVIQDIGPWDQHPTVTNDAEHVVEELTAKRLLPDGRRLFYVDSDGRKDEIVVKNGRFFGFALGPGG